MKGEPGLATGLTTLGALYSLSFVRGSPVTETCVKRGSNRGQGPIRFLLLYHVLNYALPWLLISQIQKKFLMLSIQTRRDWLGQKIISHYCPFNPSTSHPPSKSRLKLVCNVNILNGNLKFENSQDYARNLSVIVCSWVRLQTTLRSWARICKWLWSPGIDSVGMISPAYVAWGPVQQIGLSYQPARLGIDSWAP